MRVVSPGALCGWVTGTATLRSGSGAVKFTLSCCCCGRPDDDRLEIFSSLRPVVPRIGDDRVFRVFHGRRRIVATATTIIFIRSVVGWLEETRFTKTPPGGFGIGKSAKEVLHTGDVRMRNSVFIITRRARNIVLTYPRA